MSRRPLAALFLLIAALALLGGCAAAPAVREEPSEVAGFVDVDPATGALSLRTLEGERLEIRAPPELAGELARLPGARVVIAGERRRGAVRARAYELVDPGDALTPYVGVVVATPQRVLLRDEGTGALLPLQGEVVRELRRQEGAKVWVTGFLSGVGRLQVIHYGVLRPAPEGG